MHRGWIPVDADVSGVVAGTVEKGKGKGLESFSRIRIPSSFGLGSFGGPLGVGDLVGKVKKKKKCQYRFFIFSVGLLCFFVFFGMW